LSYHYPGKALKTVARAVIRHAHARPSGRRLRITTNIVGLPVTPLSRTCYGPRPEALRPRLAAGLPLRCGAVDPTGQKAAIVSARRQSAGCTFKKKSCFAISPRTTLGWGPYPRAAAHFRAGALHIAS
jgi:hypothetical protein